MTRLVFGLEVLSDYKVVSRSRYQHVSINKRREDAANNVAESHAAYNMVR